MTCITKRLITAAAVMALTAGAAHAHRAWILPSQTVVSKEGAWVTLDAAASNNLFFPDHRPMQIGQITVTAPDGAAVKPANALAGQYRTTFDVKLDQRGTYRIANASSGYSASWKEGAETMRWRGTMQEYAAQGIDKKPGVELSLTNRRVETFVTVGAPTELKASGRGLELVPVTHPNDLYAGESATFKFTDNGKPAAGLEVVVIAGGDRYRDGGGELKLKTEADGTLKVDFEGAGMYWLNTESSGSVSMEGRQMKSSSSYVAVLEVLP
jgi:uncharacterized GH25 family protein